MNDLMTRLNDEIVVSSVDIAKSFGKRHDHVLRGIKELVKKSQSVSLMFLEGVSQDSYGRQRKTYYVNKDGFALLVMGFTGKEALRLKLEYIEAFNSMEQELKQSNLSTKDLLLRAMSEYE